MDLLLRLERTEPPAGIVLRLGEDELPAGEALEALAFAGWLGLLRALADVLAEGGGEQRSRGRLS